MQSTFPILSQPHPPPQAPTSAKTTRFIEKDTVSSNMELLNLVFEALDETAIVEQMEKTYTTGRRGFPKRAMFRAASSMYFLNYRYQNDLIDELKRNSDLREACGFKTLPDRRTFNRNFKLLANYADIIDDAISQVVEQLHHQLPDLGKRVAVDSTAVRTYSNGNRKIVSDPEAGWGVKNSSKTKGGKPEMYFGYKAHMIADVTYGIPLAVDTGKSGGNDYGNLIPIFNKAETTFNWFVPDLLIGDRGYDANKNYDFLWRKGIHPIIKNRDMAKDTNKDGTERKNKKLYRGIYDKDGVPHCPDREKMDYVLTDPKRGHFYQCPHCPNHMWVDPMKDIRRFGTIRRESDEWKAIYRQRDGVERPWKSMKQHRRLEHHTVRGRANIHAHVLMSTLLFLTTVAVNLKHRPEEYRVWMTVQTR